MASEKTERNDEIVRMYKSGMSCRMIAPHYGLSYRAVHVILKRRGVQMRPAKATWWPNKTIITNIRAAYHRAGPDHPISKITHWAGHDRNTCIRYLDHLGLGWGTHMESYQARRDYALAHPEMSTRELARELSLIHI